LRAVLFKGKSTYDALGAFTGEVAQAFQERGVETVVADLSGAANEHDIQDRLKDIGPVDFGFTFFVFGDYVGADGRMACDLIGAPLVIQYVDYPLTHRASLERTSSSSAILTVDPSHVDLIRKLYGPNRFVTLGFSPHAGIGKPATLPPTAAAYAAERPIPILFCGSGYRPGEPPWKEFPPYVSKVFAEAAELAMAQEFVPALDAVDATLKRAAARINVADPQFLPLRRLADRIHEWVRANRRQEFFKTAAKVGLPLTIYGRDFAPDDAVFGNVSYRGEADFTEVLQAMRQSQIVMNINANFGYGSHERPFTAMVAGAVAASDFSTYYADAFDAGREIVLYWWTHLEEHLAGIRDLLHDRDRLFEIAQAGHAKACRDHRWPNRIDNYLAAAQTCMQAWKLRRQ
jgi:hypothetical protein